MSSVPNDKVRVEQTSREVIEQKLLTSLADSGTVAILAGREELDLFILGMDRIFESLGNVKAKQMAADLRKLRDSAFPR